MILIKKEKNQQILMKDYLSRNNAEIVFYSTESYLTIETLRLLKTQILEIP